MTFNSRQFNIESWLELEEAGLLQKISERKDIDGTVLSRRSTRVSVFPAGYNDPIDGHKVINAPCILREFTYTVDGTKTSSVPVIAEWEEEDELQAEGHNNDSDNVTAEITGEVNGSFSVSGLSKEGKVTILTIGSGTWTALPSVALLDRNAMGIQNQSETIDIKVNYDNLVSGYNGIVIKAGFERYYDIKDTITIYAKTESGTAVIVVEELA